MPEYRNPNAGTPAGGGSGSGGGQDNRSFLTMMVVLVGVLIGMQVWRSHNAPATANPATPAAVTAPANHPQSASTNAPLNQMTAKPREQAVGGTNETTTVVENELYRISFSNRGGQVTSWILKRYKDNEGHPLDLVHKGAAALYGYPLSLYTWDQSLTADLSQALFQPSQTGELQAPATLKFDLIQGNVAVHKSFTFGGDYTIHADTVVTRDGAPIASALAWPSGFGDIENAADYAQGTVDNMSRGAVDHIAFKKVSGGALLNGPFDWAGTADKYFATAFLPDDADSAQMVTFSHLIDVDKVDGLKMAAPGTDKKNSVQVPILGAGIADKSGHVQTRIFVGPKDVDVLKALTAKNGKSLWPIVDFGFWGYIGEGLFLGLHWVHEHIARSWGWAIIVFTVAINLVLLPLRIKSMQSALKMQRLQPQTDAIRAKFKNPGPTDPKAADMNAEIMKLQKDNGVSMWGGCVPTLIQMPLLFAFFTMMTRVVELRQAHFFWLPDLSGADPKHILPILMVLTSFVVQYFTPSPGVDPQQQRMMAFMMPAFSGYMTWNYASGLALYWNCGNIIMMIQQFVMNRTSLGKEMREIQAKRAKRKTVPAPNPAVRTIQGRR